MSTQEAEILSHKERLLRHGMKLFYAQGFHGTTVDAILASAGVPKGSFYHHFGSKEAFAQAVLDRYMQFQIDLFHKWAAKKGLYHIATARRILHRNIADLRQVRYQRACLTGKFSTEVATTSELFREQLAGQLQAWTASLVELLRHGQENGDVRGDRTAEELADAALALIQGAFVIALATRDKHTLAAIATTITHLIERTATTRRK